VVVFVAIVVAALRQRKAPPTTAPISERRDKDCILENNSSGHVESTKDGKVVFGVKFGSQCSYQDGRSKFAMASKSLEQKRQTLYRRQSWGQYRPVRRRGSRQRTSLGSVKLTSEGTEVTAEEANYNQAEGTLTVPGAVAFERGRMQGTGAGATYDFNREVLWLLTKPHIIAPDDKGQDALDATAEAAGLARAEHYLKLTRTAHIHGEGRDIDADDITIFLTEDNEKVQQLELRGNSRIVGSGDSSGPRNMSARDIDLMYAADGRTLQHSKLVENAVVQLAGEGNAPGKRIAGKTVELAMSPDGKTVTNLNASEKVQVDIPPDGDTPAKRIRSATLTAIGAPGTGLQNATFGGNVDYRESREARGALAAVDRQARALSLIVATKPGFGALEQADFHGNVHFTDGPQVVADATHALYHVDRDQIDLSPSADPGPPAPRVSDGRVTVEARTIEFALTSRKLKAETKVRARCAADRVDWGQTRVRPPAPATRNDDQPHVPALLAQDQPVTVTSNRLDKMGPPPRIYIGNSGSGRAIPKSTPTRSSSTTRPATSRDGRTCTPR
jgi:lipopolysaccharide export system protein LptA